MNRSRVRYAEWLAAGGAAIAIAIVAGVAYARRDWARRVGVINGQVDAHARHWTVGAVPEGAFHYVALGDSAAQGVGAPDPSLGYVGNVARRLEERLGRPVHITNLSVSGAKIADVVHEQLPLLTGLRPDLVTAVIGGNDVIVSRLDLPAVRRDLEALCAAVPPGSVVAEIPYFGYPFLQSRVRRLNRIVHDVASRYAVSIAPLHAVTRARWPRHILGDLADDLFHPGVRGYRVWAAAVWTAIEASGAVPQRAARAARTEHGPPDPSAPTATHSLPTRAG